MHWRAPSAAAPASGCPSRGPEGDSLAAQATDVEVGSISSEDEGGTSLMEEVSARVGQVQEQLVWERADMLAGLRLLPDAEDWLAVYDCGERADSTVSGPIPERLDSKDKNTGLLVAAYLGLPDLVHELLRRGADHNASDGGGRTALHLASCSGSPMCVSALLSDGAKAQVWDALHRATPLHCAAAAGSLDCIRHLVAAKVDVDAGLGGSWGTDPLTGPRSPLHFAVRSDAPDCVQLLLQAGASPNTLQVFTETPLHLAAAMGSAQCVALLLEHGADVRVQFGTSRATALHLAAEDGNAECARLLLEAGADTAALNCRRQTPLHLAALAQSPATLQLLLAKGADPSGQDDNGRTPLHCAIVKVSRSAECVRMLLQAGAQVNLADNFGYTPLHMAALNEFSNYVLLLLAHGGDVTARTKGGVSVLSFIVRRTPDVLPKFMERLDSAVRLHDHEIGDVDCELKMDFRILIPNADRGESILLLDLIEVGQRTILQHPLCETFLFLKWRRIRKFFLLSLLFHSIFVILYSLYVIGVYPRHCSFGLAQRRECEGQDPVPRHILLVQNILLVGKELFQLAHGCRAYIRQWENWLQLLIVLSVFLCVAPFAKVSRWQHHVAALGIFFTWLELMMIVGRFPMFGLYVQMFTTVAINFSKFLLAYCCLLVAFALSFAVLFANYPPFKNVAWALMKTVVMMSGELEFEDIFYNNEDQPDQAIQYPYTAHFLFLMFVLLATVILTNLLVGLAVSDIQGLQKSAGLDRLVRQAELVAHLESMLFSRLLRWLPAKLLAVCHRSALLLSSPRSWALFIRPNDPRECRIPRYLVRRAYRLVAERRERGRRQRLLATEHQVVVQPPGTYPQWATPGHPHGASLPIEKQHRGLFMYNNSSLRSRPGSRLLDE